MTNQNTGPQALVLCRLKNGVLEVAESRECAAFGGTAVMPVDPGYRARLPALPGGGLPPRKQCRTPWGEVYEPRKVNGQDDCGIGTFLLDPLIPGASTGSGGPGSPFPGPGAAGSFVDPSGAEIGRLLSFLTNPSAWKGVGLLFVGGIVFLLGFVLWTGKGKTVIQTAKKAAVS